jgi:hypothetical protein
MNATLTEQFALANLMAKLKTMSAIAIALWVSIAIHAVLLAIKFEPEIKKNCGALTYVRCCFGQRKNQECTR